MPDKINATPEQVEQVEEYAALGWTQDEIAEVLPYSSRTFRKRLQEQGNAVAAAYRRGRAQYKRKLTDRLADIALADLDSEDVTVAEARKAIQWVLKTQFGWVPAERREITGKDGGPVAVEQDPREELERKIERAAERVAAQVGNNGDES